MAADEPDGAFGIDHGELEDCALQLCFVLGFEMCQIYCLLNYYDEAAGLQVHSANKDRIETACRAAGRSFRLSCMPDDKSETWLWFELAAHQFRN